MKITKEDKQLIEKAKEIILKSNKIKLVDTADVGSALITKKGNIYTGVCIGHYCGIGSCAEYQAIGNMISNGEKNIKTIVAVWYEQKKKKFRGVIPPCGKCREMINQTSKENINSYVIISNSKKVKLKKLLPYPWGGTIEK
jgi:cytidine deaminase